jgi:hypothetical protein
MPSNAALQRTVLFMRRIVALLAVVPLACLFASPALAAERPHKVEVIYPPAMGIHDAAQVIVPPLRAEPAPAPTTIVNVDNNVNVRVKVVVRRRFLTRWEKTNRALFQNYTCFCREYSGRRYPF